MSVFLYIVLGIFGIVALLFVLLVAFALCMRHQATKIILGLPWLRWLTLEQCRDLGFSPFWCKMILPSYHRAGYVETRIRSDLSDEDRGIAELIGFRTSTVEFYEFKLTKRGGRRRRPRKLSWDSWVPDFGKPA